MSQRVGAVGPWRSRWERLVARTATTTTAVGATRAVVALLVLLTVAGWTGLWLEDRANPPTCHGIGWGCTPDAATSVALLWMIVLGPALVLSVVSIWVGRALARSTRGWRHLGALLVVAPVILHLLALLALQLVMLPMLPGWLTPTG